MEGFSDCASIEQIMKDYRRSRRDGTGYIAIESEASAMKLLLIGGAVTRDIQMKLLKRQYCTKFSHFDSGVSVSRYTNDRWEQIRNELCSEAL